MLIIDLVLIIFPEGQLHVFAAEIGDLGSIPVSAASASPLAPQIRAARVYSASSIQPRSRNLR